MYTVIFTITLIALSVFSWGFVNRSAPYPHMASLLTLVEIRPYATVIYIMLFAILFVCYIKILTLVKQKKISLHKLVRIIGIAAIVLFLGFPGFSYDVFNYMATAKVIYTWHENPYILMPIEIPDEPMLSYMHAANKTALYGPVWIMITAIPHYLGFGNPLLTVYLFKLLGVASFLGVLWLIWRLSEKSIWAIAFFALNPLVLTEILLSGHNDAVMMFFALLSLYLLTKKKYIFSIAVFMCSILIKYATILLVPIYLYALLKGIRKEIWVWSAIFMYIAFLLSPVREEIYSWYFVWPLTFLALIPSESALVWLSYGFTFGLPYRLASFIYWREWSGLTPMVKKLITSIPPVITGTYGYFKNR